MNFITDHIDQLRAEPLGDGTWRVSFRSANAAMHHQLYVNGILAAWTDSLAQRQFTLHVPSIAQLTVAAVEPVDRTTDGSNYLPAALRQPPWTTSFSVVRSIHYGRGSCLCLLDDHAGGEIDPIPLAQTPLWPPQLLRWAFGEDRFARGAFGYDGSLAPGLAGAMGAGLFGFGADTIRIAAVLDKEGQHQVVLRIVGENGAASDQLYSIPVSQPPLPPASLAAINYDPLAAALTLQIQ